LPKRAELTIFGRGGKGLQVGMIPEGLEIAAAYQHVGRFDSCLRFGDLDGCVNVV